MVSRRACVPPQSEPRRFHSYDDHYHVVLVVAHRASSESMNGLKPDETPSFGHPTVARFSFIFMVKHRLTAAQTLDHVVPKLYT